MCTSSQITVLFANSPIRNSCLNESNKQLNRVLSESYDVVVGDTSDTFNRLNSELKSDKSLNDCINFVDSTSSSDMSDYIETMSLSSRTSSGSDPTYVRSEDLTLKPQKINSMSVEAKQEYSVANKMIDCLADQQKEPTDPLHSPSPGYESENCITIL